MFYDFFLLQSRYQVKWNSVQRMHTPHSLPVSFPQPLSFTHWRKESKCLRHAFLGGWLSNLQRWEPRFLPFKDWQGQGGSCPCKLGQSPFSPWLLKASGRASYRQRGCLVIWVGVKFKAPHLSVAHFFAESPQIIWTFPSPAVNLLTCFLKI